MAKKLSKRQKRNLQGFEDVIEFIIDDDKKELNRPRRHESEDYELFNYLEKEIKRLEKIDHFFRHGLEIVNRYSQTKSLLEQEQIDLDRVKNLFIKEVTQDKSQFLDNMDAMYLSVFKF